MLAAATTNCSVTQDTSVKQQQWTHCFLKISDGNGPSATQKHSSLDVLHVCVFSGINYKVATVSVSFSTSFSFFQMYVKNATKIQGSTFTNMAHYGKSGR